MQPFVVNEFDDFRRTNMRKWCTVDYVAVLEKFVDRLTEQNREDEVKILLQTIMQRKNLTLPENLRRLMT